MLQAWEQQGGLPRAWLAWMLSWRQSLQLQPLHWWLLQRPPQLMRLPILRVMMLACQPLLLWFR
jgi:hypothetical protein